MNRVETRVEVRFVLQEADWIPDPIRARLRNVARNRITDGGELVVRSSRFRSQARNLDDCLSKLQALLQEASAAPRRRVPTRPTGASRERKRRSKEKRRDKKERRRWRSDGD